MANQLGRASRRKSCIPTTNNPPISDPANAKGMSSQRIGGRASPAAFNMDGPDAKPTTAAAMKTKRQVFMRSNVQAQKRRRVSGDVVWNALLGALILEMTKTHIETKNGVYEFVDSWAFGNSDERGAKRFVQKPRE